MRRPPVRNPRLAWPFLALAAALLACLLGLVAGADVSQAAVSSVFPDTAFGDDFESGTLGAWNGVQGTGLAAVTAAAAHGGGAGLNLSNTLGQWTVAGTTLPAPVEDSATRFWVRVNAAAGVQTIAMARDAASSARMWELLYDGANQRFYLFPYRQSGSAEIDTEPGTAPAGRWIEVEVRYTASTAGGAQLFVDGQTKPAWGISGDFSRTTAFRTLQLWNDAATSTDFDDVHVDSAPPVATPPGAPSGLTGTSGDASVALTWTPPASDGRSPITGYRITPHAGATALTPVLTGSTATTTTVTGLSNGTAYTFTVAAVNAAGTGDESAPTDPLTPRGDGTVPGAPTGVAATAGDRSIGLTWTAPADDGGRTVTGYRITRYEGGVAQPAVTTGAATHATVTGLQNGTAYSFRVAALNAVGASADSAATDPVTPGYDGPADPVFADGFESGSLSAWSGGQGNGLATVGAAGARSGAAGLTLSDAIGQYEVIQKAFADDLPDSTTRFSVRVGAAAGIETVAQARDANSSARMWELLYDGTNRRFYFYPHTATGTVEIVTPAGSAPLHTWIEVEVRYDASADGNARLYLDGQSPAAWGTGGDFAHATGYRLLQLWNDTANAVDFDDVSVAARAAAAATVPTAPTAVSAARGDGAARLAWTAPARDGGRPVTGYRITPFVAGVAQPAVLTGSTDTSATVTGLVNGTAYTFTVAAINDVGTGPASAPSAAVTPSGATVPGAPTGFLGTAGPESVELRWTAPADDGGADITGYRITPYAGGVAQAAIDTGSTAPRYTVTGLTDGTAYTFRVAAVNAAGTGAASDPSPALTPAPAAANPIALENQHPGTSSWQFDNYNKSTHHEIEGYASAASVDQGHPIDLMVSLSSAAQYTMDVYRMGWYPTGTNPDGSSCAPSCGGRLMRHIGPLDGFKQAACPQDDDPASPDYGLTECSWTPSLTLDVPATWTSGQYIVKLTRLDGTHLENYLTFVVRDDASTAPILYSLDVTSWQAYNFWGGPDHPDGASLIARWNDETLAWTNDHRAYTVSFDRPYMDQGEEDGAGQFMIWEFSMVRWLESRGYDVTYVTDVDQAAHPGILSGHRVYVNAGHEEYASDAMRAAVANGIAAGVNVALLGGANFYQRITSAPDANGVPLRRVHTDKGAQTGLATVEWRNLAPARPENALTGVMVNGMAASRPFLVADPTSWVFAGTGLSGYAGSGAAGVITSGPGQNAIDGLIGYEFDSRAGSAANLAQFVGYEPAGVTAVGRSFVPASDNGVDSWADTTLYTAPSGATVFAAGTVQWSQGLFDPWNDGFCNCGHRFANPLSRQITANVVDRLSR